MTNISVATLNLVGSTRLYCMTKFCSKTINVMCACVSCSMCPKRAYVYGRLCMGILMHAVLHRNGDFTMTSCDL